MTKYMMVDIENSIMLNRREIHILIEMYGKFTVTITDESNW